MDCLSAAAIIRGLCIGITGKPIMVKTILSSSASPSSGALLLKLSSFDSDERAAERLCAAHHLWKEEQNTLIPKIVLVYIDDELKACCEIGKGYGSVKISGVPEAEPLAKPYLSLDDRAELMKDRIALVTGAAQGIGEEIVRNLAALGAFVYIADINFEGAEKLADEINAEAAAKQNRQMAAIPLQVNLTNEDSVKTMFDKVLENTGGFDLLVSNAGVLKAGSVLDQELDDFKFVTDINYTAFFTVCKYGSRILKAQNFTAPNWKTDIVQINSKSGLEGSNKNAAYAGSKFGSLGLVTSFALELVEYNVKVNAICPGNFLDGPLWSDLKNGLLVQYLKAGKVPGAKTVHDVRAAYEAKVPMGRGCTGKDLARALLYLIEQEYETGQALPVTGGQVMLH